MLKPLAIGLIFAAAIARSAQAQPIPTIDVDGLCARIYPKAISGCIYAEQQAYDTLRDTGAWDALTPKNKDAVGRIHSYEVMLPETITALRGQQIEEMFNQARSANTFHR